MKSCTLCNTPPLISGDAVAESGGDLGGLGMSKNKKNHKSRNKSILRVKVGRNPAFTRIGEVVGEIGTN